jgi:hypothetical protein
MTYNGFIYVMILFIMLHGLVSNNGLNDDLFVFIFTFRNAPVNHMARAIGISVAMAAEMGVTLSRRVTGAASISDRAAFSSDRTASSGGSSCSGSSCGSSSSLSSGSSNSSSSRATGPASPDLVVNASPDEAWLATPRPIPLTRAVAGNPVASTSGGGETYWKMDVRQRRLERTLLDARGQIVPRRSKLRFIYMVAAMI